MTKSNKASSVIDSDTMEIFIVTQQEMLYRLIETHKEQESIVDEKQSEYEYAWETADYTRRKIISILTFLEAYNSTAHDDWFAAVGYDRYTFPMKPCYGGGEG